MGEFLVSKEGIGYLIIYGTQVFNLDLVLTGVAVLIILSYIFYKPIAILESKMLAKTWIFQVFLIYLFNNQSIIFLWIIPFSDKSILSIERTYFG